LYTGYKTWIWLSDRESYRVEIDNKLRNVWIGEICYFQDVLDNTCLQYIITDKGIENFNSINNELDSVSIIYARCKKSMFLLDEIHRKYVNIHNFKTNDIVAIKSVAGSGKTTSLLNLSKIHNNKRVLYIAFNKSLITEIKDKIKSQSIQNMFPFTFDALLYKLFISIKGYEPEIIDLRPQFISNIIPFLDGKPYKVREYYCNKFTQFCNDADINDIRSFCLKIIGDKKPLLEQMWDKVKQEKLITFESIRKQAYINKWFKSFIDTNYDLIMIDETQDFDMIMLKMLLNDTTIPKIFVGDPMQSIYDFRGCINAFNYLPKDALIVEFYSTFRIGNPACDIIRSKFKECWMISKSKNETNFVNSFELNEKYVYLFRSWRVLLQTAENTQNIWIYSYDKKINEIRNLHKKLSNRTYMDDVDNKFEDDLPKFLTSITSQQLENLLNNINTNIVNFEDSVVKFYTTHSYKGMENEIIRLSNDINICEDENIYYVAITRGMKKILIDE
jgi:superfamily I DNA/RNA helicase